MGHIRLGQLPAGKRWKQVVELLRVGGGVSQLAAATARAAETELQSAKGDPALAYTVWLLTQLPLAARSPQFAARLGELGFDGGAEQSVLRLVAGFSVAVDRNVARSHRSHRSWGACAASRGRESFVHPRYRDAVAFRIDRRRGPQRARSSRYKGSFRPPWHATSSHGSRRKRWNTTSAVSCRTTSAPEILLPRLTARSSFARLSKNTVAKRR